MKFWKYIELQEESRNALADTLLDEIAWCVRLYSALQKDYDELLKKYVKLTALEMKRNEKALVVVNPLGFVGSSDEKQN